MQELVLISPDEQKRRLDRTRAAMLQLGIGSALVSSNANIYYLTGRVFSGYVYLPPEDAEPVYFVKRPVDLLSDRAISMRKPEDIPSELRVRGWALPRALGLELGRIPYNTALRLARALGFEAAEVLDANPALALARSVKTDVELEKMRMSGAKHELVYRRIPQLYSPGMTDIELQIEIERSLRLEGCLGQLRADGEDMEVHMGNLLAGDNADSPSPYDFSMGGAGLDPSLPVGANGTLLRPGMTVMADMNGDFTGYMTDMTRTYSIGRIDERAAFAHQVSIDICRALAEMGRPGVEARALYEKALEMAKEAGLEKYFMGHRQHAGFVGHGIGIDINELPVLAPRSKSVLQACNTIAVEPKFVIPGTGAVGIENTYIVKPEGPMECITRAPEELISLE